jgi:hypothetical protein
VHRLGSLTSDGRPAKTQSAELMASIVAERLIARLERDGFVIMQRPLARGALAHLRVVLGNQPLSRLGLKTRKRPRDGTILSTARSTVSQ